MTEVILSATWRDKVILFVTPTVPDEIEQLGFLECFRVFFRGKLFLDKWSFFLLLFLLFQFNLLFTFLFYSNKVCYHRIYSTLTMS